MEEGCEDQCDDTEELLTSSGEDVTWVEKVTVPSLRTAGVHAYPSRATEHGVTAAASRHNTESSFAGEQEGWQCGTEAFVEGDVPATQAMWNKPCLLGALIRCVLGQVHARTSVTCGDKCYMRGQVPHGVTGATWEDRCMQGQVCGGTGVCGDRWHMLGQVPRAVSSVCRVRCVRG